MSTSRPARPVVENPDQPARKRPRINRRRRLQPGARYAIALGICILVAILVQFAVHMTRTDPRDTRMIAERELHLNALEPGERVVRSVSVFRRPAINYFRATRGVLAITDKRLLYLGLEPRDLLASTDLPPTFEQREFAFDTLVRVSAGRTFFGIAKAVEITTPYQTLELGVPSGAWPKANLMIAAMSARHDQAVASSARQRAFLAKAESQRRAAEAARRMAKFYFVKRGDALASIALMWNTTPEKLREWNRLPDNRIRVGQRLMVKPAI